MWSYLARRLVQVPIVLVVATLTVFLVVRATPGDPVQIMLGMQTSPDAVAAIRAEFRLDEPVLMQYIYWVGDLLRGDLGRSIRLSTPVTTLLAERFPVSLRLAGSMRSAFPSRSASWPRCIATAGSTGSAPATPWQASPSRTSRWR